MNKKRRFLIMSIPILVLSCLILADIQPLRKPSRNSVSVKETISPFETSGELQSATSLPIKVFTVRLADLGKRIKSPGGVYAERKVVLKAEAKGVLKKLHIEEGLKVKAGQVLAELDDTPYRLQLEQDEASRLKALSELLLDHLFKLPESMDNASDLESLKKAEESFLKAEVAQKQGLISQTELDKTRRDYELALIGSGMKREEIIAASKGLTQAEVKVKIARLELEKTRLVAPFSGIVTQIKVAPGENLEVGREICTLVDLRRLKIEAKVLETEVGKIKEGQKAYVSFSAYPEKVFLGRVAAVSPLVSPTEKTCSIFISLDNDTEEIKPGMHAVVEIVTEVFVRRLLVPQEAVLIRGGRPLVFVVENGLAKWRYIQIGQENDQYVEVLDGVKEGDPVIIEGHLTLAHDSPVRIIE